MLAVVPECLSGESELTAVCSEGGESGSDELSVVPECGTVSPCER